MATMAKAPESSSQSNESSSAAPFSLPSSHFAKLSPASFLAAHLPSSRPSGRAPITARPPTIQKNSLTYAQGSAVVRIGSTAVVCGIRAETLAASDTNAAQILGTVFEGDIRDSDAIAELGLLVPNIELATGCNPQHLPGNPPSVLAQSLTQRVLTLLRITDLLRLDDLRIWDEGLDGLATEGREGSNGHEDEDEDMEGGEGKEGMKPTVKAFWTLYIDILFISLDGAPFDGIWGSVMAALGDLKLPKARWDVDRDMVLCDPRIEQAKGLNLRGCPIALTFSIFNPPEDVGSKKFKEEVHILTDPDDFEESCCSQTVTVVVDQGGKRVWRLEVGGGSLLGLDDIELLIKRTGARWEEWTSVLGALRS